MECWLKAAGVRAAKTAAEAVLGYIGSAAVFCDVNWKVVLGTALLSVITSLLWSVKGLPELEVKE